MPCFLRLSVLLVVTVLWLPASAAAISYPVTNRDDSGEGSLREAILNANSHPGADSISIGVTGTINLKTALPPISEDLAIAGPGADDLTVRREAFAAFRIFDFADGVTASLSGLTVANGLADGEDPNGGGISNGSGSLTLTGVVLKYNETWVVGGLGAVALGGGIHSTGSLTLRNSTVWENRASAEEQDFFLRARGGGVYAEGPLVVDSSTISKNYARAMYGVEEVDASGGGISADELTLVNSTIVGNSIESESEDNASGANLAISGTSLVRNTMVGEPIGAESCSGPLTSGGFNLGDDRSCDLEQATDREGVFDLMLGPLANNGGPTPTHALLPESPAIDTGNAFGSATDQRGLPRPSDFPGIADAEGGDGSDIGAFELQVPPPSPVLVNPSPADRRPPNTRLSSGPPRVTFKRLAKFRFASSEAQSTFQCKVDKKPWRGCRNPYKRKVSAGRKHVFKVRAIDRFGNVDPTPARFGWRVKKVPK
jgi:hypothetical protein